MGKWFLVSLLIISALCEQEAGYEHAYALPTMESLEEKSLNRPDATSQK